MNQPMATYFNFAIYMIFAYILAWYWWGVLSGKFANHGPWANADPDTFIHGALPVATALFVAKTIAVIYSHAK